MPRWSLAIILSVLGLGLAFLALKLPWRGRSTFSFATGVTALGHLVVAIMAAVRHRRLPAVWRIQSALTIAYVVFVGWGLLSSAWYIGSIYRGLGAGVSAGLVVLYVAVTFPLLPTAIWGLIATHRPRRKAQVGTGAGLVLLVGLALAARIRVAEATEGHTLANEADAATVAAALDTLRPKTWPQHRGPNPTLGQATPMRCDAPPGPGLQTALVAYVGLDGRRRRATHRCLQAPDAKALGRAVTDLLSREAQGGFVRVDLVTRTVPLDPDALPVVDSLALRPGLDGACHAGTCLTPWQLVVLDAFNLHAPVPGVGDARLGAALDLLVERLGGPIVRIATTGWVLGPNTDGPLRLARNQTPDAEVTTEALSAATEAAAGYVHRAQQKDGRFRYTVNPFSGRLVKNDLSIPRQAGTTLAVCELADRDGITPVIVRRALSGLAKLEQRIPLDGRPGLGGVLRKQPGGPGTTERMGPTALGLAAFVRCRPYVGARYDDLIGRLARAVVHQQRADGSFAHYLHLADGRTAKRKGSIYVDGQIVLGLSLLELHQTRTAPESSPALPDPGAVHDAVEAAMSFFGTDYWPRFIRPIGFIEENWHCIAAAASLEHHRHDAYERFCIDYVTFKSRLIHAPGTVRDDLVGGYGLGNIVPPHNTATAGYGEAAASALRILQARNEETQPLEGHLRAALAYLLRNQWRRDRCFACAQKGFIPGGFSEHPASGRIRIDYVQHAWSALGHGGRALGLLKAP